MRKTSIFILAMAASTLGFAASAVGINNSSNVYLIDDTTGADTFVNSLGLGPTLCLACRRSDDALFTISGGSLFKFFLGGSPTLARTLPFLSNPQPEAFAIDGAGVGWVIDSGTKNLFFFGLGTNNTLIGNVGVSGIVSLAFGRDGSLYGIRSTGTPASDGLYLISRTDGHVTRVSSGNFVADDVEAIATPPGFGSLATFLATFNTSYKINSVSGTKVLTGGSSAGLRGLAYQGVTARAVSANLGTVNFGTLNANPLDCLQDRDGSSLRVCRGFVPNLVVPPIQFTLNSDQVATGTIQLNMVYASRMSSAGSFQESTELLNVQTGAFDPLPTFVVNTTKHVVSNSISNAINYISANRVVTTRFKVKPTGFVASQAYCFELDQFVLEYQ